MSERQTLFDDWAATYERDVATSTGFPFAGYELALATAAELARPQPGDQVLDIGVGIGHLAERFSERDCAVTGVDFSPAMLEQAAKRLPAATLLRLDLRGDRAPLAGRRFDVIASGYVLHEFDDAAKIGLLTRLRDDHLAAGGRIVIADIAFETRVNLERTRALGAA